MSKLTLTEAAVKQFKQDQIDREAVDHNIRIAVAAGGCSGFQYQVAFEEKDDYEEEKDVLIEQDDLSVVVDKKSLLYLEGVVVDHFQDPQNLAKRGYTFENPNSQGGCGCGSSFSV
ncbi:MAG: HesB/IscA family protein [Candidatus Thorarchaeota archaeon]|jgi:iron-sulfur cluster assembly protein